MTKPNATKLPETIQSLWQHEMELETLIEVYKKMVASHDSKETKDKQWQLILNKQELINTKFCTNG